MTDGTDARNGKGGKGIAYALLGLGILIVLGGGVGLEIALSHQRGPNAARAASRAATTGATDATPAAHHAP
jgi:hypothetical protein